MPATSSLILLLSMGAALVSCAAPGDGDSDPGVALADDPRASVSSQEPADPSTSDLPSDGLPAVPEVSAALDDAARDDGALDTPEGEAAMDEGTAPASIFGAGQYTCPSGRVLPPPALRLPSVIVFEPYGPVEQGAEEQLAGWTDLLIERHDAGTDPERAAILEAELEKVHIVDLTPAYMNLIIGLDMASPEDVDRIGTLNLEWYNRQYGYKALVIDGDPTDMRPQRIESRMVVVDGWRRWWDRTIADPAKVARYRKRLDDLDFELKRIGRDRPVRVRSDKGALPR